MSQDLKEESERGKAWSSTFPSQNLLHPQGLVWTCLGSPGNPSRNSVPEPRTSRGGKQRAVKPSNLPGTQEVWAVRRDPEPSPSPVSHALSPSLCLYSCRLVEKAGGGGPARQWAAFTVAFVSGSPMSGLLSAIKIIGANANSGGQPEAQRGAGTQHEAKAQSDSSDFSPSS